MPALLSVNVATPVDASWAKPLGRTAIDKRPCSGRIRVEPLGVTGDQVADTKYHGGPNQAVYAFAREDLDHWQEQLQRPIGNGQFGENLTTTGIDVNESLIGERWLIGSTVFEVGDVRIPCNVFKAWLGEKGFDNKRWVKRFTEQGRPGPYLRVIEPGDVAAGDGLTVIHRPDHEVTVTTMFRAFTTDRSLMPRLLDAGEALSDQARAEVEKHAAGA